MNADVRLSRSERWTYKIKVWKGARGYVGQWVGSYLRTALLRRAKLTVEGF